MESENQADLSFLEKKQLRRIWHKGEWYYSITDVIALLTDSPNPRQYWSTLKTRAKTEEGFDEALVQIEQLRLQSQDHRFRLTDTANRQTLLRIIQSIPSPRAEPFRLWLAQIGEERFEELENPEAALERVRAMYRAKGYDDTWIDARIRGDLIRNELTDEWLARGARRETEFAILTNVITEGTFGLTIQAYKTYKLLPARANLRDHMDPLELALTSLSEATAVTFHRTRDSQGFGELKRDATDAGRAGGRARQVIEEEIGRPVPNPDNYLHLKKLPGSKKAQKTLPRQSSRKNQAPMQPGLFDETGQKEE